MLTGTRCAALKGLWQARSLQGCGMRPAWNFLSCRTMSSRLFVGGLSFTTEEEGLGTAFSKYGEVVDVRIVLDRESGRSRGFGFVTFLSEADAETAKDKLNGQWLDGRVIRVDRAAPRPAPTPPPRPNVSPPNEQTSQDWGSIPSPIAAVPQNAGSAQNFGGGVSAELPSLSSLTSSPSSAFASAPLSSPLPSPPSSTPAYPPPLPITPPTEPPRSPFNFNLDFSTPDPNYVPRSRPPRLRPSMMDYEFGLFSDTSKFPFNTNFGTGFLKVRASEADFDFLDIKEANDRKKAEELATNQALEAATSENTESVEGTAMETPKKEYVASSQLQEEIAAGNGSSEAMPVTAPGKMSDSDGQFHAMAIGNNTSHIGTAGTGQPERVVDADEAFQGTEKESHEARGISDSQRLTASNIQFQEITAVEQEAGSIFQEVTSRVSSLSGTDAVNQSQGEKLAEKLEIEPSNQSGCRRHPLSLHLR
ncbi:hypothetical protein KP509_30G025800 [Ceratopteris richardii]|uniref:RRM domain-containing protein n=1 Tax=Ceratopteris richardii TaxID=49495 RepID=A0A8T2R2L5_CERRI|nr:hypothetical protein KP509_30G025800 [Ceratopteris richardii]